jgi:hypothetical protein
MYRRIRLIPALLISLGLPSWSQSGAQLTGQITDKSRASVPGAAIAVKNLDTGIRLETRANGAGYYVIADLAPGSYELTVSMSGFRGFVRSGLKLEVSQVARVDATLEVGDLTERIEVVDTAPLLASNHLVDHLVDNKSVVEMPLNGRNAWDLAVLAPAAVYVGATGDNLEIPQISVGGGRSFGQSLQIDGAAVMKPGLLQNQAEMSPMIDAVQEFRVLVNGYSAEHGRAAGGVFSAVTKSGTNQFRGSAFEFFRNDAMNALNYFALTQPKLRFNQFGGTFGGPVHRDKTFFFGAIEVSKNTTGSPLILTMPTAAMLAGDFSGVLTAQGRLIPVYDPNTSPRTPYAGNRIPSSQFDPVAAKLNSFYPAPNQAGMITGANNFNVNLTPRRTQYHNTAKVDHYFGPKDRIYGRYINQSNVAPQASVYPVAAASGQGGSPSRNIANYAHSGIAHYTRTVSPSILNELDFSILRQDRSIQHESVGGNWPEKLGLKGVDQEAFPAFQPSGYAALGAVTIPYRKSTGQAYLVSETVNYTHGSHFVKAGGSYRRSTMADKLDNFPSGNFAFNQAGTALTGVANTGNGFATMLIGSATSATVQLGMPIRDRDHYISAFLQDDWKATPRLTLNIGLRFEAETAPLSPDDSFNSFDPLAINPAAGVPGVVTFAGVNGVPRAPFDTDWNNVAPRVGLALRLGRNSNLRAGYGLFYGSPNDLGYQSSANMGFSINTLLVTASDATSVVRLRDGVKPYSLPGPADRTPSYGVGTAIQYLERERRSPYSQQFNLGLERVWRGTLLDARYLGNLGRRLTTANLAINQIRPELVGKSPTPQSVRPFPQFTAVNLVNPNLGLSNYHALSLHAGRRYRAGTQFSFNYTFSKFIENVAAVGGALGAHTGFEDYYNRRLDRGLSANDVKHNVVFNGIWELPFGRRGRWMRSGWGGSLAGGWQLSTLGSIRTGAPIGVTSSVNNCQCFSAGSMRPDLLRDPTLPADQRSANRWFDITAFALPAMYRFGTAGPTVTRAPGLVNLDLSAMRNFALRERFRLQFRGEFFNALNHVNLGNPATVFGNAGFGAITTARPARVIQLGLKIYL